MNRFQTLSAEGLPELLSGGDALLLDCRQAHDYQAGHLDGAIHADEASLGALLREGDRNRPVVVYCYHGISSQHLAQALAEAGFGRSYSLAGGYQGWLEYRDARGA